MAVPSQAIVRALVNAIGPAAGAARRVIVAYSGGRDSHVLLHALATADVLPRESLLAVHVDHGLHPDSATWALHAGAVAAALGVPFECCRLEESPAPGDSVEAWARAARYRKLESVADADDLVVTAHHRDDAVETLLLNLLRGAGPHGLRGMAARRPLGRATLVRPLLSLSRADLEAYAAHYRLGHVEDPSNALEQSDRNYLRRRVVPLLVQRWPGLGTAFDRAARLQRDAAAMIDEVASADLAQAAAADANTLSRGALLQFPPARRGAVIRTWLREAGLPVPDEVHLREIERNLLTADGRATPMVTFKGAAVRRHGDALHAGPTPAPPAPTAAGEWRWRPPHQLALPGGSLSARPCVGRGLSQRLLACGAVTVRFRRGGERMHPEGRDRSRDLKRLLQEWGVPPWERDSIPLVFVDGRLAAVVGFAVERTLAAGVGEAGWFFVWTAATSAQTEGAEDYSESADTTV